MKRLKRVFLWVSIMLVCLAIVFLVYGNEKRPTRIPGLTGSIVFVYPESCIKKYNLLTGEVTWLTEPIGNLGNSPQGSPRGDAVFCTSGAGGGIYRVTKDGTALVLDVWAETYSYLGNDQMVYSPHESGGTMLVVSDLKTGKNVPLLTDFADGITGITSAGDIIFSSKNGNIYKVEKGESNTPRVRELTKGKHPVGHPDGKRLAYVRPDEKARRELVVLDLETGKITRTGLRRITELAWLGDTNYLIYERWWEGIPGGIELGVIDYTTRKTFRLLRGTPPSWGRGVAWVNF